MKAGDFVKVVDPGCTYTTYSEMFKRMNFNNTDENVEFEEGAVAQIFSTFFGEAECVNYIGVVDEKGNQSLLSSDGLEVLNFVNKFTTYKNYSIPIAWECYRHFKVRAGSLQEAIDSVVKHFLTIPDDDYLDDSFDVDSDYLKDNYPGEVFDIELTRENL